MSIEFTKITRKSSWVDEGSEQRIPRLYYDPDEAPYIPAVGDVVSFFQPVYRTNNTAEGQSFTSSGYIVQEVGVDSSGSPFFLTHKKISYTNPAYLNTEGSLDRDPNFRRPMFVQAVTLASDSGTTFPQILDIQLGTDGRATAKYRPLIRTRDKIASEVLASNSDQVIYTGYSINYYQGDASLEYKEKLPNGDESEWAEITPSFRVAYDSFGGGISSRTKQGLNSSDFATAAIDREEGVSWTANQGSPFIADNEYKFRIRDSFPEMSDSGSPVESFVSGESNWISPPALAPLQAIDVSARIIYGNGNEKGNQYQNVLLTPAVNVNDYYKFVSHGYQFTANDADPANYVWQDIEARQPIFDANGARVFELNTEYRFRAISTAQPQLGLSPSEVTGPASDPFLLKDLGTAGPTVEVGKATILSAGFTSRSVGVNKVTVEFEPPRDGVPSKYTLETSSDNGVTWTLGQSVRGSPDVLFRKYNPKKVGLYFRIDPREAPWIAKGYPKDWPYLSNTERASWLLNRKKKVKISVLQQNGKFISSDPFTLSFNAINPNIPYKFRIVSSNEAFFRLGSLEAGVPLGAAITSVTSDIFTFTPESVETSIASVSASPPTDLNVSFSNYETNISWKNSDTSANLQNNLYYRQTSTGKKYGPWILYDTYDVDVESVSNVKFPTGVLLQFKIEATHVIEDINQETGEPSVESGSQSTISEAFISPILEPAELLDYDIVNNDLVFSWVNSQTEHTNNIFKYRSQSTSAWTEIELAPNSTSYTLQDFVTPTNYTFSVNGIRFYDTGEPLNGRNIYQSEFTFSSPRNLFEIWTDESDDLYMTYERNDKTFGWGFGAAPIASGMSSISNLGTSTDSVQISAMSQTEFSLNDGYFFRLQAKAGSVYANTSISSVPLDRGFYWGQHKRFGYYSNSLTYIQDLQNQALPGYTHLMNFTNPYPFLDGNAIPVGGYWDGLSSVPPVLREIDPNDWLIGPKVEIPEFIDAGIPLDFPDDQGIYPVKIKSQSSPSYTALVDVYGTSEGFFRATTIASLSGYQSPASGIIDPNSWTWGPRINLPVLRVLKDLI